jgi:Ni,Fe-hydrogenase maturation factor
MTHEVTPASLLMSARDWYGYAPRAHLITVGGKDFAYGEALSAEVSAALPGVLRQLDALTAQVLSLRTAAR